MTVRLTHTEPDLTPPPQVRTPQEPLVEEATDPTGSTPVSTDETSAFGTDSRITLREARRHRRRTAWLCAAVVAVCLSLTIVVVSLARTRPPPGGAGSSAQVVTVPSGYANSSTSPVGPHLDASAPEGGTP